MSTKQRILELLETYEACSDNCIGQYEFNETEFDY